MLPEVGGWEKSAQLVQSKVTVDFGGRWVKSPWLFKGESNSDKMLNRFKCGDYSTFAL